MKRSRAVATRYDKRGYVFHGTATTAALSSGFGTEFRPHKAIVRYAKA